MPDGEYKYGLSPLESMYRAFQAGVMTIKEVRTSAMGRFTPPPNWNSYEEQVKLLVMMGVPEDLARAEMSYIYAGRETALENKLTNAIIQYAKIPATQFMSMNRDQAMIGWGQVKRTLKATGRIVGEVEGALIDNLMLIAAEFWNDAVEGRAIYKDRQADLAERVLGILKTRDQAEDAFLEAVRLVNQETAYTLSQSFEYVKNLMQAQVKFKTAMEAAETVRNWDKARRDAGLQAPAPGRRPSTPSPTSLGVFIQNRDSIYERLGGVRVEDIKYAEEEKGVMPTPDATLVNTRKFRFEEES